MKGEWLQPGQHLDLIGAYNPRMREVDDLAMQRASVFVDSRATTLHHIGELIDAGREVYGEMLNLALLPILKFAASVDPNNEIVPELIKVLGPTGKDKINFVAKPISLPVVIGILMLMGIVTKNAIMLVDFAVEEIRRGVPRLEAIVDANMERWFTSGFRERAPEAMARMKKMFVATKFCVADGHLPNDTPVPKIAMAYASDQYAVAT